MVQIEQTRRIISYNSGFPVTVLDLQCSAVSDLPALNALVNGALVAAGSIAQVIQTGAWYTLDADGQWYFSGGVAPEEGD